MVPTTTFDSQVLLMAELMDARNTSVMESDLRRKEFYRLVGDLHEDDFIAACTEILHTDQWFPTVARIREVAERNSEHRLRVQQATTRRADLVCPTCHGAHWVRLGGYDPVNMLAGEEGSRVLPCPNCTTTGKHNPEKERFYIQHQGGVPNPNSPNQQGWEPGANTWRLPRTADGRPDMEALYQESRRLRKMPPGDDRPRPVGGFHTLGSMAARVMGGADEPVHELVAAGVGDEADPW